MAHFAELDKNNVVLRVIVADQSVVDSIGGTWIETNPDNSLHNGYAGKGNTFHPTRDAFSREKPDSRPSFIFNDVELKWEAPLANPIASDGMRQIWNEDNVAWEEIPLRLRDMTPQEENEEIKRLIKAVSL